MPLPPLPLTAPTQPPIPLPPTPMLNWITLWLESLGYLGVFALMVLEHLIPPIPSEVVMPLSGFIRGRDAPVGVY